MTQPDHPARQPATEQWLDTHHVVWTFTPNLDLTLIDTTRSRANQARIGEPIVAEVVDRYTADMRRGDTFPPLLAHRPSVRAKKLTLLGGNHRHAAALQAGHTTAPAYIVDCAPEAAIALTYEDNRRHGFAPTTAERVRQAIHLIDIGWKAEAAAAAVGVSAPAVSQARKAAEGARRARELGIPAFDTISADATRTELARIGSDPVFEAAARLVIATDMSVTDTVALGKRIKAARSDDQALQVIAGELEERRQAIQQRASGRAPKAPATPYGTLNGLLVRLADLRPADVAASCPTPDARARLRKRIASSMVLLNEIREACR